MWTSQIFILYIRKPLTSISSLKAMSSLTRPSSLAWDARFENQVKGIQYLLKSECSDSKSVSSCDVINPAHRLDGKRGFLRATEEPLCSLVPQTLSKGDQALKTSIPLFWNFLPGEDWRIGNIISVTPQNPVLCKHLYGSVLFHLWHVLSVACLGCQIYLFDCRSKIF